MYWRMMKGQTARAGALLCMLLALTACGGGGSVEGSAEPVPEPTPQPQPEPTPTPEPQPSDPDRFVQVAPDVQANPSYQPSPAIAYELGHLPVRAGIPEPYVFLAPVRGWIRFPQVALQAEPSGRRFPIVLLLHGNHDARDPSYRGYDYLARNLAEHGYVAVSIDANAINASANDPDGLKPPFGDVTSVSRAQLILGTLDRLREVDNIGGPGILSALRDRLDFERVGLMGHSRGGQGLSNAIKFNLQRDSVHVGELKAQLARTPNVFEAYPALQKAVTVPGVVDDGLFRAALQSENVFFSPPANLVKPYHFRGGLLLAPTDFLGTVGLSNIPLAVVLPSCDGDVIPLHGARTFDNNRFGFDMDGAARMQLQVRGGNHNFYNTEWKEDDTNAILEDPYCDADRTGSPHLNAQDQRRGGLFLINGFMRHFVGGEAAFGGYWSGLAQLPAAACPQGEWPCDARAVLTVQKDQSQRLVVHGFAGPDSLARNALGGEIALSGFDATAWCDMPYGDSGNSGACLPARLPGFEYDPEKVGGLRSIAEHVQLAWSRPHASVAMALPVVSARAYDVLSFRMAVVRPFGQEAVVTLVDTSGRSASVEASRFSDALYSGHRAPESGSPLLPDAVDAPYGDGQVEQLLNMVAIPLAAFHGVDLGGLAEVRLVFPGQSGKVALADLQFQRLGRP